MYERIPFAKFLRDLKWRQGEHWFTAAPTQTGKTTITADLVARRRFVVVLVSKLRDPSITKYYRNYEIITSWPPKPGQSKVLLWPKPGKTSEDLISIQQRIFAKCYDDILRSGGWTVVTDEQHWVSQFLRLDRKNAILQHQGSSSGITVVNLSQRPAWIPRITYSSASHALIGSTSDPDDLKALSQFGGRNRKEVIETVQQIGRHDLLYLNPMGTATPVVINSRQ